MKLKLSILATASLCATFLACGDPLEPIPSELKGTWIQKSDYSSHKLVINSSGFQTQDNICSGSFEFKSFKKIEDNRWAYKVSGEETVKGEISLDPATSKITVDGLASKCYGEDLIGSFLNEEAIKFPDKVQGTWSSCDAERCPSVEFTIASKSVSVAGKGFEDCISDSATLESIEADGPIITVKHSGMTSSGWELNINIVSDDEIKIGGAETFAGTYKKGTQDCPSRTIKPYDWGSDDDDDDDDDDYDLGDLGCAAECLAEQVECQEDCGDTDFGCIARCGAEGLSCQEDC